MEIQQEISLELNKARIGNIEKVLIDRLEGDYFVGRSQFDSPEVDNEVLIPKDSAYLRVGDFAQIKINEANEFDLIGEIA